MEARTLANPPDCDLVVRGRWGGESRRWLFDRATQSYRSDRAADGLMTRATLLAGLGAGDSVSFMGVLSGQGARLGGDEDLDTVLDGDDPDGRVYNGAPRITQQPRDRAVPPGGTLVLEVRAVGVGLSFQWKRNGQPVANGDAAVLNVESMTAALAGEYEVMVTSAMGQVSSRRALVEVYPAPQITVQPVGRRINRGQSTSLSVTASGQGLSYQWMRGNLSVQGATERTLAFPGAQGTDSGVYSVVVSNGAGSVRSEAVELTVVVPPVMTQSSLPAAIVGQAYTAPLTAANGPTRFQVTGLPKGLAVAATGLEITGRAAKAGIYPLRISASNSAGGSAAVTVFLEVREFPPGAVGRFEGTLPRHAGLNQQLGGAVRLTTTAQASFSGTLQLGAVSHALRGRWITSGTEAPRATLLLTRRGLAPLSVTLEVDPATRMLSGKVAVDGEEVMIDGGRALTAAGGLEGNHTVALLVPSDKEGDAVVPQGDGVGGFKVSPKAMAAGAMVLADGSRMTFASPILEGGRVCVFQRFYEGRKTGSLHGKLRLTTAGLHRMEGSELSWWKNPQILRTRSYAAGFGPLELRVRGGRYEIPAAAQPLPGMSRASVLFTGGGVLHPEQRLDIAEVTLPARHPAKVEVPEPNPGRLSLTVQPGSGSRFVAGTTGSFSGSFTLEDPDSTQTAAPILKRRATLRGVLVDDGTGLRGYGHFLLPEMPALTPVKTTLQTSPVLSGRVRLNALQ